MTNRNEWWGYRHVDGSLHPKRWINDPYNLVEARESPFVATVVGPFPADNREEALATLKEKLA